MGSFGLQVIDKLKFRDEINEITAEVEFGSYFFKKQDFIWGEIKQSGRKVSEITGNYTGYVDFDEKRYWDYREKDKVCFPVRKVSHYLPSDSRVRSDAITFQNNPVEEAQAEKERLENIQRNDRKLREVVNKRRQEGGAKHVIKEQAAEQEDQQ